MQIKRLSFLVLLITCFTLALKSLGLPPAPNTHLPLPTSQPQHLPPGQIQPETQQKPPQTHTQADFKIEDITPHLDQIRKEIRLNPHRTPPSFLKFAEQLGDQLALALQNEHQANTLFQQLSHCVETPPSGTPITVLALCLNNANRLAKQFPHLSHARDALFTQAPPEALRLITIN